MNPKTQLRKAYIKRLNLVNDSFFKEPEASLNVFIEHLKFTRDMTILQQTEAAGIFIATVAELEAYQTSNDPKQKEFHWNNFCNFLKLTLEEKQALNDSV